MRLFGTPTAPEESVQLNPEEQPSQGGSANLQIQEAIRQAELANDIEKANRLRQQLYATPEGQLLTPRQQQERIEAEPFKQAAEQKAMISAILPPKRTRLRRSRPRSSVPNK